MIEPKKIRKGDVVATKHQSIIVERIEGEGKTSPSMARFATNTDAQVERQVSTDTSTPP